MAGGLAIIRFISFKTIIHAILAHISGIILILWGGAIIIFALFSYLRSYRKLELKKNRNVANWILPIAALPLLFVMVLLLWITLKL
jgi:uncharacterized membrane protein YidH (DUF202 family)